MRRSRPIEICRQLGGRIAAAIKHIFAVKKIVVISEKKIASVTIPTFVQVSAVAILFASFLWVTFASKILLTYQDEINAKDEEILDTTLANRDLLKQIQDLQTNLSQMSSYFEHSSQFKLSPKNATFNSEKKSNNVELEDSHLQPSPSHPINPSFTTEMRREALSLVADINTKMIQRIYALEQVISATGLQLNRIRKNAPVDPEIASLYVPDDGSPKGGPFIPVSVTTTEPSEKVTKENFIKAQIHLEKNIKTLVELEGIVYRLPITRPMKYSRVTSLFGTRADPFHKRQARHLGIDLVGRKHASVLATAQGVVVHTERSSSYGLMVDIRHSNGVSTRYGHLSKIFVKPGQKVERNQKIGQQGSTGRSTGDHLHYEVHINNTPVNPIKFLRVGDYVLQKRQS